MTREQLLAIFTDNGLEAPNKGVINQLMNSINSDKAQDVEAAKKTAKDEAEAKYKGFVKPEDHQKIVDELNAEKGKGALAERKAKYEKAKLNVEDEDILALIEGKLKDSKDFDKDLEAYVKAHPSFLKQEEGKEKENPAPQPKPKKVNMGGVDNENPNPTPKYNLGNAINEHYSDNK